MTALPVVPVGLLNGLGVVGLSVLICLGFVRGWIITRREANAMQRQIEALMDRDVIKDQTIADFSKAISESNSLTRAFLDLAREKREQSP
jgi:hypothetical protein